MKIKVHIEENEILSIVKYFLIQKRERSERISDKIYDELCSNTHKFLDCHLALYREEEFIQAVSTVLKYLSDLNTGEDF